jgi:radical SAM superfamily enzyme YgiQ (UPF0313 family)
MPSGTVNFIQNVMKLYDDLKDIPQEEATEEHIRETEEYGKSIYEHLKNTLLISYDTIPADLSDRLALICSNATRRFRLKPDNYDVTDCHNKIDIIEEKLIKYFSYIQVSLKEKIYEDLKWHRRKNLSDNLKLNISIRQAKFN